jgi:hypothetical protein
MFADGWTYDIKTHNDAQFRQTCDLLMSSSIQYTTTGTTIHLSHQTGNANDIRIAQFKAMLFPYRQLTKFTLNDMYPLCNPVTYKLFEFAKTFSKEDVERALAEVFQGYDIKVQNWNTPDSKQITCHLMI